VSSTAKIFEGLPRPSGAHHAGGETPARKPRLRYYVAAAVLVVGRRLSRAWWLIGRLLPCHRQPNPCAGARLGPPGPAPAGQTAVRKAARPAPSPAQDGITRRVLPDIPLKPEYGSRYGDGGHQGCGGFIGNVRKARLRPVARLILAGWRWKRPAVAIRSMEGPGLRR